MRRHLFWLPALALAAGCGGGGTNPTPVTPEVPAIAQYPVYKAVSEEGNELFLQVRQDAGDFDGRYAFFYKQDGSDTDIMDGAVEGTVDVDGTIHMTLYNPYDESAEPIEIEGRREGENLVMADASNPEDVETFEPVEAAEGLQTRAGLTKEFKVTLGPIEGKTQGQTLNASAGVVPVWLIPALWWGSAQSPTADVFEKDRGTSVELLSWGNGWTKVKIGYMANDEYRFEGWVKQNFAQIGTTHQVLQESVIRLVPNRSDATPVNAVLTP
ncbi:MAG: hypothetical protein ACO1SV_04330 [Fimbriimonas sp.]